MNPKRIDIHGYEVKSSDKFLFDANIWIYLAGPQANSVDYRNRIYSKLLRDIIIVDAKILHSEIIISEYINRCVRTYYEVYKATSGNTTIGFKDYRDSTDFANSFRQLSVGLELIHRVSAPADSSHWSYSLKMITKYMTENPVDYNDILIAEMARNNDLLLVTHDYDMIKYGCSILSANRRIA